MKIKAYESDPIPFKLEEPQYRQGVRDYAVFADNTFTILQDKYEANIQTFEKEYEQLFNDFLNLVEKSKAPQMVPKEVDELRKGYHNFTIDRFIGIINSIERNKSFEANTATLNEIKTRTNAFIKKVDQAFTPLSDVMRFFRGNDPRFQRGTYFFPARNLTMKIDTAKLISEGIVKGNLVKSIVPEIKWTVTGRGVSKNGIMILDLIDNNQWKRPIYFAITASRENFLNLEQYLHREGLAYRLLPAKGDNQDLFYGSVNTDIAYDNLMNKFKWGNITDPHTYLDENNLRMLTNFRYTFASLALALAEEKKNDKAKAVLDKAFELFPDKQVPFNLAVIPLVQAYYAINDSVSANKVAEQYEKDIDDELTYYKDIKMFNEAKFAYVTNDFQMGMSGLYQLQLYASAAKQKALADKLEQLLIKHDRSL
jgi:hypothetical protein